MKKIINKDFEITKFQNKIKKKITQKREKNNLLTIGGDQLITKNGDNIVVK